jgi:hypothetical protein
MSSPHSAPNNYPYQSQTPAAPKRPKINRTKWISPTQPVKQHLEFESPHSLKMFDKIMSQDEELKILRDERERLMKENNDMRVELNEMHVKLRNIEMIVKGF